MRIPNLKDVVSRLILSRAHIAVKYVSPTHRCKVTRILTRNKIPPKNQPISLMVSIGKPNYLERQFIKQCIKAGEKFPVRKIQLKFPPVKRVKTKKAKRR